MTNAELIAALRYCGGEEKYCKLCPSYDTCHAEVDGLKQILLAAADAIQTLCDELATYHAKSVTAEKRIAELKKDIIYWQTYAAEIERWRRWITQN